MKNNKNTLVPKLRFPEFVKEEGWIVTIFNEIFKRITLKNKENNQNVLTISAQRGLISQLEYFNKSIAAKDVSGYYLIKKGDFAYNKSYSQGYPMGAIKSLKYYDEGVVSTLYICFRINKKFNSLFFDQYFDSGMFNSKLEKIAQEGARNHGLLNININEFFNLELIVPPSTEQQKIADLLISVDELISEQGKKIDALKVHKKGLMQQLFPAEGKTVPKLRFPEFKNAGEWEETQIHDLLNYERPDHYIVSETNYIDAGTAVLTANKGFILGYTDETFGIYNKIPVIIFDDFTVDKKYVDFPFKVKSSAIKILSPKNNINLKFIFELMNTLKFSSVEHKRYYISVYQNLTVFIPSSEEQQKIADCLSSLDTLITEQSKKLTALQQHKKGLMQQIFPSYEQ